MIITPILVLHRYLGVVLGVLMTVWCLSGFVMMYQGFPATTPDEREAGLAPLEMTQCCTLPAEGPAAYRIEMLNGGPLLRPFRGPGDPVDLATGQPLAERTEQQVRDIAIAFQTGNGRSGELKALEQIRIDQWSAQVWRRNQPLWRAKFDDSHWVYVSGKSGEVVQDAGLSERWLSWFGAVPHWLYPTILRENQQLWSDVVIYSSAVGCFLTITGLVVGFVKLRSRSGKWFPYKRPMWFVHHVIGTFAGILVLTWTFSGLMTMSPWGLLESKPTFDPSPINGRPEWVSTQQLVEAAKAEAAAGDVIAVRTAPMFGAPFAVAMRRGGQETRIDTAGPTPLAVTDLHASLQAQGGQLATAKLDVLEQEDAYYYQHKGKADLPVYRLKIDDGDKTIVYLNPATGEIRRVASATAKRYRWFEIGLHSLDYPVLRNRPFWDVIVLLLMAAVTVACATGAWLSFTRIGTDFSRIKSALSRKKPS